MQFILLTILCLIRLNAVNSIGFDGIEGRYCAVRPVYRGDQQVCCTTRDDECTMPILGGSHLCYCDYFCLQHAGRDCCPDFREVCLGERPPQPTAPPLPTTVEQEEDHREEREDCVDNDGRRHGTGDRYKYNCNECMCGSSCDENACVINPYLLRKVVENGRYSWQAKNYSQFWGMPLDDGIKYRLGTLFPERSVQNMNEILIEDPPKLPEHFDAREKWPSYVHPIRDQKDCGSSWAFSTIAVSADRLAIQSDGQIDVELSTQQLISCNQHRQRGCKGGYLDRAWWYIHKLGVVSENCYPYRSGETRNIEQCLTPQQSHRSGNVNSCPSGDPETQAYKTTPVYRISSKQEDIMAEIFMNGPVQATFLVHEDFYMYAGGIYRHLDLARTLSRKFRKSAYHSVRIIGWGTDKSTGRSIDYWLCDNSWGSDWGEDGFFRILRGENHCEIESYILAAWGKTAKRVKKHLNRTSWDDRKQRHYAKKYVRRLIKY